MKEPENQSDPGPIRRKQPVKRIMIVEDNEKLGQELKIFLSSNGYDCSRLESFDRIVDDILEAAPDLLLLDLGLPGADGHYICRELRRVSSMPIIIITSRQSELDELTALNFGADNYVTKPFNLQILLAKISALLRRTESSASETLNISGINVNIAKGTVSAGGNSSVLTKNELMILRCLIGQKGRIVTRETIMQYLWDDESFVDDNTLTVNIARLRKKLDSLGQGTIIRTRRGQGYILE